MKSGSEKCCSNTLATETRSQASHPQHCSTFEMLHMNGWLTTFCLERTRQTRRRTVTFTLNIVTTLPLAFSKKPREVLKNGPLLYIGHLMTENSTYITSHPLLRLSVFQSHHMVDSAAMVLVFLSRWKLHFIQFELDTHTYTQLRIP